MPRVILLVALLVAAFFAVRALSPAFNRLGRERRRRLGRAAFGLVGVAVVVLVLARFGLQWLGVVGGAAWAVVRALLPTTARGRGATSEARANASAMSRAEALEALGLEEGASEEQILRAYRNLIRKVHPDTPGGSAYLATKLNQAKDVLLS